MSKSKDLILGLIIFLVVGGGIIYILDNPLENEILNQIIITGFLLFIVVLGGISALNKKSKD